MAANKAPPSLNFIGAFLLAVIVLAATRAYGDCLPNSEPSWVEQTPEGERVHRKCLPGYVSGQSGCEAQAAPAPSEEANAAESALTSQICATRNLIAADQKAINALNFALTANDFEEIAKFTEERKNVLKDEAALFFSAAV
jgi:hypothetical protein